MIYQGATCIAHHSSAESGLYSEHFSAAVSQSMDAGRWRAFWNSDISNGLTLILCGMTAGEATQSAHARAQEPHGSSEVQRPGRDQVGPS